MPNILKENLIYAVYYAPRGRQRIYTLARDLAQRHLHPSDLLIGVIGTEGSGKSMLIRGLFPGLELTNDDAGVNRATQLYDLDPNDFFAAHTFHIDVRYEAAFRQKYEIAEAVHYALQNERRVVVEHFDLLYPYLGYNAAVLLAIGEEVIVSRPNFFGPYPAALKRVADATIQYRQMAHSAEDLVSMVLDLEYGIKRPVLHSDVKHGFVISFDEPPDIDVAELDARIRTLIAADWPISYVDENHISIGEIIVECTGPRIHVKSTGCIEDFRLVPRLRFDQISHQHMLIGTVGSDRTVGFESILQGVPDDSDSNHAKAVRSGPQPARPKANEP